MREAIRGTSGAPAEAGLAAQGDPAGGGEVDRLGAVEPAVEPAADIGGGGGGPQGAGGARPRPRLPPESPRHGAPPHPALRAPPAHDRPPAQQRLQSTRFHGHNFAFQTMRDAEKPDLIQSMLTIARPRACSPQLAPTSGPRARGGTLRLRAQPQRRPRVLARPHAGRSKARRARRGASPHGPTAAWHQIRAGARAPVVGVGQRDDELAGPAGARTLSFQCAGPPAREHRREAPTVAQTIPWFVTQTTTWRATQTIPWFERPAVEPAWRRRPPASQRRAQARVFGRTRAHLRGERGGGGRVPNDIPPISPTSPLGPQDD